LQWKSLDRALFRQTIFDMQATSYAKTGYCDAKVKALRRGQFGRKHCMLIDRNTAVGVEGTESSKDSVALKPFTKSQKDRWTICVCQVIGTRVANVRAGVSRSRSQTHSTNSVYDYQMNIESIPLLVAAADYSLIYLLGGGGVFGAIVIFFLGK
jgi:hypothetical protein